MVVDPGREFWGRVLVREVNEKDFCAEKLFTRPQWLLFHQGPSLPVFPVALRRTSGD